MKAKQELYVVLVEPDRKRAAYLRRKYKVSVLGSVKKLMRKIYPIGGK